MDVRRINRVSSMLLEEMRNLSDEGRDLPIRWNIMHMYTSSQIAKVLALRRGMGIKTMELAAIAAALHDIAVVATKKHDGHAEAAEPYVREAIARYNSGPWAKLPNVTQEEEDMLVNAIAQHNDKDTYTDDPFVELLKDADSMDRYLHGAKTEGAYLDRCRRVMAELGIVDHQF